MTVIGYTMMCEQAGPKELVRDVQTAEAAGFECAVISDHYFPWVDAMGHSPYAWSVFGAAVQVTSQVVRRRMEGQLRVARPGRLRGCLPVRAS